MIRSGTLLALATAALALGLPLEASASSPLDECDPNVVRRHAPDWLPGIMKTRPILRQVMKRGHELRFQMVVGEVVTPNDGQPCLRLTTYRHGAEYTYPASSIKMVGAIGAMKIMQETPDWELDTPVRISSLSRDFNGTTYTLNPGTETTMQTLLDDTLVVSSNLAFNSLYDIAGRDFLNDLMTGAGLDSVRLWHRLSQTTAPNMAHAWAPGIEIRPRDMWRGLRDVRGPAPALKPHVTPDTSLGIAYIDPKTGEKVDEPMDFSAKNGVTMRDLMAMTVAMTKPELMTAERPFGLTDASRAAIRSSMTKRPAGADEAEILALEARFKPLSPGVLKAFGGDRSRFTYVNKAGRAYGFHLESAYIEDTETGRGYFVAVTLWPNENQVLNDNRYEYDELSYPAFTALGEVLTKTLLVQGSTD